MTSHSRFTLEEARAAGERIGVDWGSSPFDLGQFRMGMDIELEHGTRDPETNVTDDDVTMTAKIARAHLNEFPDYYTRLAKMEAEAEASGGGRDRAGRVSAQTARPLSRVAVRARPAAFRPAALRSHVGSCVGPDAGCVASVYAAGPHECQLSVRAAVGGVVPGSAEAGVKDVR